MPLPSRSAQVTARRTASPPMPSSHRRREIRKRLPPTRRRSRPDGTVAPTPPRQARAWSVRRVAVVRTTARAGRPPGQAEYSVRRRLDSPNHPSLHQTALWRRRESLGERAVAPRPRPPGSRPPVSSRRPDPGQAGHTITDTRGAPARHDEVVCDQPDLPNRARAYSIRPGFSPHDRSSRREAHSPE